MPQIPFTFPPRYRTAIAVLLARRRCTATLLVRIHESPCRQFNAPSPRLHPTPSPTCRCRLSLARQGRQGGKKRSRGVLPYAWQELGIHGDFDQVAHLAQISKADYMAGLEDELE